jgi:hypothetical protein
VSTCVLFVCKCVLYCCHRVSTCVLFVCKCVLYCCHWVSTQLRLYIYIYIYIISYRIVSYIIHHIIYIISRTGLCPWDNWGKAKSCLPPVNKNLPHTRTTMRQQRYGDKAEMCSVRAMHTFSCTEICGTMLQRYVLTCGRPGGDRLFGAPSKSAPGARAPGAPPKGRP